MEFKVGKELHVYAGHTFPLTIQILLGKPLSSFLHLQN